jgi:hypothetical protein
MELLLLIAILDAAPADRRQTLTDPALGNTLYASVSIKKARTSESAVSMCFGARGLERIAYW